MDFKYFFRADFVTAAVAILSQLGLFLRWLYKKKRNAEIQQAFIQSMATNHLPHIQDALYKIALKVGVDLPPPPPIEWLELNGKK